MTDKRIYQIGLTMINGVGDILARHLLQALGEATVVRKDPWYRQQYCGRNQTPGNLATGGKRVGFYREKQYFLLLSD